VENQQKTISIAEKLDVITWLEKGGRNVEICHNVRLTHSSVGKAHDNPDTITGSAKLGITVFVSVARLPQSYRNEPYQKLWIW